MKPIPTALAALSGLTLFADVSALSLLLPTQAGPTLYSPTRSAADQKIRLRSWGSGLIAETEDAAFEGTTSLRITSRNFFQGGTLIYEEPVNLTSAFEERTNLLRLVYQPLGTVTSGGGTGRPGGGPGGMPGGPGGRPGGGPGGPGGPGGRPGGGPGGPGGSRGPGGGGLGGRQGSGDGSPDGLGRSGAQGPSAGTSSAPSLRNVRLVVTTTDNLRSEAYILVATSISTREGWRQVGIPLKAIRGFERTNKTIKEITFASDSTSAFYLGDLRVVSDPTPIRAEVRERNLNLALNDIATLTSQGEGGSSVLRYTWDFDDKDGIGVDAEGASITHKFRKPGTFTVTLTVQDEYGLKDPYSTTIQVKVNG